jgi:hypothetical protein
MKLCTFVSLFVVGLLLTGLNASAQVEVITRDSAVFKGIIVNENYYTLRLRNLHKVEKTFNKTDIISRRLLNLWVKTKDNQEYEGRVEKFTVSGLHMSTISNDDVLIILDKSIKKGKDKEPAGQSPDYDFVIYESDISDIGYITPTYQSVNKDDNSEDCRDSYGMFGLSVLSPGGVNCVLGFQSYTGAGFRIAAGTLLESSSWGAQGNLLYNLIKSRDVELNASLGFGTSHVAKHNELGNPDGELSWNYIGAFADINFVGFFVEGGITFGSGSYKQPKFLIQAGYVFRFL